MPVTAKSRPLFVFAPGAGASSTHPWLQRWASLLGALGSVQLFDYPYRIDGRQRPDPLPQLITAHRNALASARRLHTGPVVLIGKSMGGRIGCHVALEDSVEALVCLGYPLCAGGDYKKLRDKVLVELRTSVLFVQGTRDALCPLPILAGVRSRMTAPNELYVVDGGDHSLAVGKRHLKTTGDSQETIESRIIEAIASFVRSAVE